MEDNKRVSEQKRHIPEAFATLGLKKHDIK